jgi:hypothetical protein
MIDEIKFADIKLVEIKEGTPHCKKHGAMNKTTNFEDNSGYWRCISFITNNNDTACRAGCHYKKE